MIGTPVTPPQKNPAPPNCPTKLASTGLPPTGPPPTSNAASAVGNRNTQEKSSCSTPALTMNQNPLTLAEKLMFGALQQLQTIYDDACKTEKKQQVTIERTIFEAIGTALQDAYTHVKHACQTNESNRTMHSEDIGERFDRLEKIINERLDKTIKETFTSTTKTWAQAAAAAPPPEADRVREIQQGNLQRKLQQRRERTKLEVTLTSTANLDTKEQLAKELHSEITIKLQKAVSNQVKNSPTIHGVQKLKSHDIRIHCNTVEEAEQLCKLKWDEAYGGLTVRQPKRGLVAHGVPTDLINPNGLQDPELAKQLESQNKGSGIQVVGMKPLRRKVRDDAQHFSLVIFVSNPETADYCIKHGIYIDQRRFPVEK